MLYPEHFIEELRQRADLVRIIEPYAPLKKKGANWMGCCPFHQEKTPSFSVNPAKGFYKCFGCGKGGTAFNFLMEIEGLSFPEAIKKVAEVSGVPLPAPVDDKKFEHVRKKKEAEKKIADSVIELNQFALEFWEHHLQENIGRQAREYLEKRGISDETRKIFRIGFAPDSWDALMSHLKSKGADEKLIEQSGLVSINEETRLRPFSRARDVSGSRCRGKTRRFRRANSR
jgi:DNA primase